MRRVVVTGMGCVTPLGHDLETTWAAMLEGRSGVGRITAFSPAGFATQIAGEVKGWDTSPEAPQLERPTARHVEFALAAARQAVRQAGGLGHVRPEQVGVSMGSGDGSGELEFWAEMTSRASQPPGSVESPNPAAFVEAGLPLAAKSLCEDAEVACVSSYLSELCDARGPVVSYQTACASSGHSIAEAVEWIRSGEAEVMVAGGAHAMVTPTALLGFSLLRTLSERNDDPQGASRPFDLQRDGFVLAEGAAVLILEEREHARAPGAEMIAEIRGVGLSSDIHSATAIPPDVWGPRQAMKLALADAGARPEQLTYINAHGTSTAMNDRLESLAIKQLLGEGTRTPVSSTKSMLGHLISAAGAMEVIACVLAIRDQVLPPTINQVFPDPECDLDYVPNQARPAEVGLVMTNNFGFGGQNTSLVIG